jgi:hypothetical protein
VAPPPPPPPPTADRDDRTADLAFATTLRQTAASNFTPEELDAWYLNLEPPDRALVDSAGGMTVLREQAAINTVVRSEPLKQAAMQEVGLLMSMAYETPSARAAAVDRVTDILRESPWGAEFADAFRSGAEVALGQNAQRWQWEQLKTDLDFAFLGAQTAEALSRARLNDRLPAEGGGSGSGDPFASLRAAYTASINASQAKITVLEQRQLDEGCIMRERATAGNVPVMMNGTQYDAKKELCDDLGDQIYNATASIIAAEQRMGALSDFQFESVFGPTPPPPPAPPAPPGPPAVQGPAPMPAGYQPPTGPEWAATTTSTSGAYAMWERAARTVPGSPSPRDFEALVRSTVTPTQLQQYRSARPGTSASVRIELDLAAALNVNRDDLRPILQYLAGERQ